MEPVESKKTDSVTTYGSPIRKVDKISIGINCECPEVTSDPSDPLVPRLWRIDCGMSRAFDLIEYLNILHNKKKGT